MRGMTNIGRAAVAAAALIALAGSAAQGDEVILKDGKTYTGTVVENTDKTVRIRVRLGGTVTEISVPKWKVRNVTIDPATQLDEPAPQAEAEEDADDAPDDAPGEEPAVDSADEAGDGPSEVSAGEKTGEATAGAKKPARSSDGRPVVLEVPMKDAFGEDIYPLSLRRTLQYAVDNGVTDVVFRINSPGGEVWAATRIVEIMEEYEEQLRYHGLIESAISASIWPMFMCDTITMTPRADFGGAVVFRQTGTGSVEVDKKLTSIYAAKLRTTAKANGHSPALPQAMMISENEVYAYRPKGSTGEWTITESETEAKKDGNEWELIDSKDDVLTLTTENAVKFGIAKAAATKSLESWATAVGIGVFDNAGSKGIELADRANAESDKMRDRIITQVRELIAEMNRLGGSGSVGSAGLSVNQAARKLGDLQRSLRQAKDLEMETIVDSIEDLDLDFIKTEIERLRKEINRVRHAP